MSERHAFLAQSNGNLALLEQALVTLADAKVDGIHALGGCAYDTQAVIRGRAERFPRPAAPTEARFADFVLASVLSGVVEAPAQELERNLRLTASVQVHPSAAVIEVEGVSIALLAPAEGARLLIRGDRPRRRLDPGRGVPRLDPGHLRGPRHEGEPPTIAVLSRRGAAVSVSFLSPEGELVEPPQTIPLSL